MRWSLTRALREIIGTDALRTVARPDLAAALGGALGIALAPLEVVEPGAQQRERLGAIAMLRTVLLHHDDDAARNMRHPHGRLGLVDVLAAGAARAQRIDPQIGIIDRDVDLLGLRQHGHRRGRGVDSAGCLGSRHALHTVHAGFEFELGEGAAPANLRNNLLVAAHRSFALRDHLDLPALLGGEALVHAKQRAGEQRSLVAAGAGADFQDHVALVHRILGDEMEPDLLFELERCRISSAGLSAVAMSRISGSVAGSAMSASSPSSSAPTAR